MTSIFEGQPPKSKAFSIQKKGQFGFKVYSCVSFGGIPTH